MKTHFVTTITMYYTEPDAEIGGEYKQNEKGEYIKLETRRGPKDVSREILRLTTENVDIDSLTKSLQKANKKAKEA